MIKILVADDHELIRDGLRRRIEREVDMQVVAEAGSAPECLGQIRNAEIDLAILDISMPGRSGIELISDVKKVNPNIYILVLTMHPEGQFARRALKSGAAGYITKDSSPEKIIKAIRKVAMGGMYISQEFAEILALNLQADFSKAAHEQLSEREFQVLRLIGQGKTLAQVADLLAVSQSSVNTYRKRILEKLGLNTTAELIHYAIKENLVE